MTGGVIASGFAAFARSRASVARIRTKPTSFPWFMEVERPRRFRKFVVMRYPHAALSAAEDVYPERILATMRQGFVVLSRLCPHDYANVRWLSRSDWFFCPGCGAQYNAVGESRVGPTPRGLDHLASLVVNGQLDIDPDDILPGAPIGTDTTGQKITGPIFPD